MAPEVDAQIMVTSLIASHGSQLRRFLLARVRNVADVPDLAQEVYLRMPRIPSAESIRSPEACLFTVAQHVLQQHQLRQSAIPPVTELTEALSAIAVAHGVDPAQTFAANQCLERLQEALDDLNPKARAVFILHRREGLSLGEIRERLALSLPMVKKYLMNSLLHLRMRIQEWAVMEQQSKSQINEQIYEEACEWFVEFRSGAMDAERLRDADRWLRKSPEQLSAYLEIAAIWTDGPSLVKSGDHPLDELIARARLDTGNVVAFKGSSDERAALDRDAKDTALPATRTPIWPAPKTSFFFARAACATVAGVALVAGSLWYLDTLGAPGIATQVGEQRSFLLDDGSTVSLNSRSRIRVRYSEHGRDVQLIEGQALFHVVKDSSRPFIVEANGTKVRAVGTEFDVYEKPTGTLVTVVEGRVAVLTDTPPGEGAGKLVLDSSSGEKIDPKTVTPGLLFASASSGSAGNILLVAGEQLSVTGHRAQKVDHANVANATAWTHRELVFEFATLAEVAEEFNRYNVRPLIIAEPGLDTFHITGMFSSTDPASIIRLLNSRPGLQVVETNSAFRIERKIQCG